MKYEVKLTGEILPEMLLELEGYWDDNRSVCMLIYTSCEPNLFQLIPLSVKFLHDDFDEAKSLASLFEEGHWKIAYTYSRGPQ